MILCSVSVETILSTLCTQNITRITALADAFFEIGIKHVCNPRN
jgi:hypothetical protein